MKSSDIFSSEEYKLINVKRLEHLASLDIDFKGKRVVEFGAGIGDLSGFFLGAASHLTIVEGRNDNLDILRDRFPRNRYPNVDVIAMDLNNPFIPPDAPFDIVFCYGILYHLENPHNALEFFNALTKNLLLLETCVLNELDNSSIQFRRVEEDFLDPSQALNGKGCRPDRRWIFDELKKRFDYVYIPTTQPDHPEFPLNWSVKYQEMNPLRRSIFLASRHLLRNEMLRSELLIHQVRHRQEKSLTSSFQSKFDKKTDLENDVLDVSKECHAKIKKKGCSPSGNGNVAFSQKIDNVLKNPPDIGLETINVCNSKCVFCPSKKMSPKRVYMQESLFNKVIDQLSLSNCRLVKYNSILGEPLLDTQTPSRLVRIKQLPNINRINLITNGIALDRFSEKELINILESVDILEISIAPNRNIYCEIFGVDCFEKMIQNFDMLLSISKKTRSICQIRLNGFAWGEDFDVDPRLVHLTERLTGSQSIVWKREYSNWGGLIKDLPHNTNVRRTQKQGENVFPCYFALSPYIRSDGRVSLCAYASLKEEFNIGNLKKENFAEILEKEKRIDFLYSFLVGRIPEYCARCSFYRPDYSLEYHQFFDQISSDLKEVKPENFYDFIYAKRKHFKVFARYETEVYEERVDQSKCDLKVYQYLLVYSFIRNCIPKGSKILEIGGGDSYLLKILVNNYECWNIDKLEGLGYGPNNIGNPPYRLVKDYIGKYSPELPENYFDLVFSISALEHVRPEDSALYEDIINDINRVLRHSGFSLHCFDIITNAKMEKGFYDYIFHYGSLSGLPTDSEIDKYKGHKKDYLPWYCSDVVIAFAEAETVINKSPDLSHVARAVDLWHMSREGYEKHWRPVVKKEFWEVGFPSSINILMQKKPAPLKEQMISYAQNYEDVLLNRVFRGKKNGFYIDVGAGDPTDLSVTKHFYDSGWHGINIEPVGASYEKLKKARLRDINLNVALGSKPSIKTFYQTEIPEYSSISKEAVEKACAEYNISYKALPVEVTTLSDICDRYCKKSIDFLKIDVEGFENEVLAGANFELYRPVVLVIEAITPGSNIDFSAPLLSAEWDKFEPILTKANYRFVYFDGLNRFYVREESQDIEQRFAVPVGMFDDFKSVRTVRLKKEISQLRKEAKLKTEELHRLHREMNEQVSQLRKELTLKALELKHVDSEKNEIQEKYVIVKNKYEVACEAWQDQEFLRNSLLYRIRDVFVPRKKDKLVEKNVQGSLGERDNIQTEVPLPLELAKVDRRWEGWVTLSEKLRLKKPLRVVFLNDNGFMYGAGIATKRQALSFLRAGHEVGAVAWNWDAKLSAVPSSEARLKAKWLGMTVIPDTSILRGMEKEDVINNVAIRVSEFKPDLIIAGNFHAAAWPVKILEVLHRLGFPVVSYLHDCFWASGRCAHYGNCSNYILGCTGDNCKLGDDEYPPIRRNDIQTNWMESRRVFADEIPVPMAANSNWVEGVFKDAFFDQTRIRTIHLGIDIEQFRPIQKEEARKKLGIPKDKFYIAIGAVALTERWKDIGGVEYILKHYSSDRDVKFISFGHIKAYKDIHNFGYVDEEKVSQILNASDVFLNMSTIESFGQTVLEASACGRPVVCYAVGGIPDIAIHGVNALHAKLKDHEEVIENIEKLRKDSHLSDRLGRQGRAIVEKSFSLEAQYENWHNYICDLSNWFEETYVRSVIGRRLRQTDHKTDLKRTAISETIETYLRKLENYYEDIRILRDIEELENLDVDSQKYATFLATPENIRINKIKKIKILKKIKVITFCREVQEQLVTNGVKSCHFQHFPNPLQLPTVADHDYMKSFLYLDAEALITWERIRQLINNIRFESLTIGCGIGIKKVMIPDGNESLSRQVSIVNWDLAPINGIITLPLAGVCFLQSPNSKSYEAMLSLMGMGCCVISHSNSYSKEHIRHQVNGFLFEQLQDSAIGRKMIVDIGKRARHYVELGYETWQEEQNRLKEFLITPREKLPDKIFSYASWHHKPLSLIKKNPSTHRNLIESKSILPPIRNKCGGLKTEGKSKADNLMYPLVTVATIVLDSAETVEKAIKSVLEQDYRNLEYIVVDGGSKDKTIDILQKYDPFIDLWISEKDNGPYDAMNKAAKLASGRWLIFINADDYFVSPNVVSRVIDDAPDTADILCGHVYYKTSQCYEHLSYTEDFEYSWYRLKQGDVDWSWINGLPAHQAVFAKTSLLKELKFNTGIRVSADYDFIFRARDRGYNIHNSNILVSTYSAGGYSAKHADVWIKDIWKIAKRYTMRADKVDRFFEMAHNAYKSIRSQ